MCQKIRALQPADIFNLMHWMIEYIAVFVCFILLFCAPHENQGLGTKFHLSAEHSDCHALRMEVRQLRECFLLPGFHPQLLASGTHWGADTAPFSRWLSCHLIKSHMGRLAGFFLLSTEENRSLSRKHSFPPNCVPLSNSRLGSNSWWGSSFICWSRLGCDTYPQG